MPFLDVAQPSGSYKITELAFQSSGWTIGGISPLTLDKGNVSLGFDTSNPYIRSNGSGTNVIEGPILLGSGTGGNASAVAQAVSHLTFGSDISFTGTGRNMTFAGGGTFEFHGAFNGADFMFLEGSTVLLANPSGEAYVPTGGNKLRLNNASAIWLHDNQINATNKNGASGFCG